MVILIDLETDNLAASKLVWDRVKKAKKKHFVYLTQHIFQVQYYCS